MTCWSRVLCDHPCAYFLNFSISTNLSSTCSECIFLILHFFMWYLGSSVSGFPSLKRTRSPEHEGSFSHTGFQVHSSLHFLSLVRNLYQQMRRKQTSSGVRFAKCHLVMSVLGSKYLTDLSGNGNWPTAKQLMDDVWFPPSIHMYTYYIYLYNIVGCISSSVGKLRCCKLTPWMDSQMIPDGCGSETIAILRPWEARLGIFQLLLSS